MTTDDSDRGDATERAQKLLRALSEWERTGGTRFAGRPDLISSGEGNAQIDSLKERLDALGARYHWRLGAREYVLDGMEAPPGAEGEPEDS